MGYNKFRWWTKGRPNKPLKADAPLLLKIRNGDFDYSYMFSEAKIVKEAAQKASEDAYKNYGGTDEQNRIQASLEAGRMKRIKSIKLELEAMVDENRILWKLRKELEKEFEKEHNKWLKTVAKKLKNETPFHICKNYGYLELRYKITSDLQVQEPIRKSETIHDWKYVESKEELENAIRILSLSEDEFVSTGTYNSISRWL